MALCFVAKEHIRVMKCLCRNWPAVTLKHVVSRKQNPKQDNGISLDLICHRCS